MTYDFMLMAKLMVDDNIPYPCEAYFKTHEGEREPELVYIKTNSPMQKITPEGMAKLGDVVELKLSYIVKGGETDA